jgi:tetratricopeptide (TPR) repeat protein
VLTTTLLVARPLVLGEDPGLSDSLADPLGMILTGLWLIAAMGWAAWRFWLRPRIATDGTIVERTNEGPPAHNWYGGLVQTALLATLAAVFVSAEYAAHYKFPARLIAWEWVGLFAAFFVVRQLAVTPEEQRGLFAVVLAGAVSLAAHGIYQDLVELPNTRREVGGDIDKLRQMLARQGILEGADESLLQQYYRRLNENNIFGPYAHPNSYAGYLVLWLPGLIGSVVVCRRTGAPHWQTLLAAGCAVLGGVALWLTHSRGAMLGLLLAGLGLAVLLWRRSLRTHWIVALAALLVLAGVGYGAWRSKQNNTVALRLEYWRTTWPMIRERPWWGVGPGNFGENYTRWMSATADEKIKDPHNFALEMWATCGVFALLALLAAMAAFFVRMGRAGGVSPLLTLQQGANAPRSPEEIRGHFYVGGMIGLLLAFLLRVSTASPETILSETWAAALRSVVWFAAYGLLERIDWSDRGRVLALTTGVAALLLNLCVSGGIAFPSVAGPLWVAVALALNAHSLEPSRWLSRPGFATILPLPILGAIAFGYGTYLLYPVLGSDSLQREAVKLAAYFREEGAKPPAERPSSLRDNPDDFLRRKVIGPLEQAVLLTPDDARLHVQLAWWYGNVWDLKLQKTRASDPRIAGAAIGHGALAARLDPQGSQGYLVQYQLRMRFALANADIARRGDNRDPLFVREKELTAQKQYEEAAKVLESYLPNDPTEAKLRYSLARAWFKAGDTQRGREQAEEALRLDEAAAAVPTRRLTKPQREQVDKWLSSSPAG